MPKRLRSFRIGRVRGYLRGRIWYLQYHDSGVRRRPRVGPDLAAARRLAAQTSAQLESGDVALLSFEPLAIPELRRRWLEHHEHVLRSSIHTVDRYRTATEHLLTFLQEVRPVRLASVFTARDAEAFVRYLRTIEVAPNGHQNTAKRRLRDKGVKYILETCRSLFTYAAKRRHLSPYAANPFSTIEIDRIPVEDAKPVVLFTAEQERQFLEACDDWQFPIFLTLMLTGLRPGELAHLLLPDDLDLENRVLYVRNKPQLGWQVKTRSERAIPLVPLLAEVLREVLGGRERGAVFLRPSYGRSGRIPPLAAKDRKELEAEAASRLSRQELQLSRVLLRTERAAILRRVWRDLGAIKADRIRTEFIRLATRCGIPGATAPKLLRHMFATCLQDANVDPLVRNILMGHAPVIPCPDQHGKSGMGLGMTAVYTQTRPETLRRQCEAALSVRPALHAAGEWLARRRPSSSGS